MARPIIIITPEIDKLWVLVLRALRDGEMTRAQVMDWAGVSERTLERRLARARSVEDEFPGDREIEEIRKRLAAGELKWVEIISRGEISAPHYDLTTNELRNVSGSFLINNGRGRPRIQNAGWGTVTTDATGPTSYEPDAKLAGGVGKAKLPETAA
jgi:hypothetical protein